MWILGVDEYAKLINKPAVAKRVQHERLKVRRPVVKFMRKMRALNQFKYRLTWICHPDSGSLSGAKQNAFKLDGYEKGVFDMIIIASDGDVVVKVWMVEFKWDKNGYTDEQQAVADMFEGTAIKCLKVYSPDEFKEFAAREFLK